MKSNCCSLSADHTQIILTFSGSERKIYLETTTRCNNNCHHCFNRSGEYNYDLSLKDLASMEGQFQKFGNITQILLSGGEFFTHPDYMEILEFLATKYPIKILSNGKCISDEFLDFWATHRNIELQITLNGPDKQTDSLIRGNCFDDTIASIKKIVAYGCSDSLTIATTLFRTNIHHLRDMISFCCSIGVKKIQFSFIYKMGRAIENWDQLSISTYDKVVALDELQTLSNEFRKEISIVSSGMRQFCSKIDKSERSYNCAELAEEIAITPYKDTFFCPRFDTYRDCKHIPDLDYFDVANGTYSIPNHLDENCIGCKSFKECLASCLM